MTACPRPMWLTTVWRGPSHAPLFWSSRGDLYPVEKIVGRRYGAEATKAYGERPSQKPLAFHL